MTAARTLGVFARQPVRGRVKTRLAAAMGHDAAARLYEAFIRDTLSHVEMFECSRVIAFTPADAAAHKWFGEFGAAGWQLWPQPDGDLGQRLRQFFAHGAADGDGAVVVIGTDSPTLPPAWITQAFEWLEECDCVLGPALDGGYVLIGLRSEVVRGTEAFDLFAGIDWGGPQVLEQTLTRLQRAKLSHLLLPPWYDVDTVDDLQILRQHLDAARNLAFEHCPAVMEALQSLPARIH